VLMAPEEGGDGRIRRILPPVLEKKRRIRHRFRRSRINSFRGEVQGDEAEVLVVSVWRGALGINGLTARRMRY
jgi:hypothetical protein